MVKAGLGSWLTRIGFTAQFGPLFCKAALWENIGDRLGRAWY